MTNTFKFEDIISNAHINSIGIYRYCNEKGEIKITIENSETRKIHHSIIFKNSEQYNNWIDDMSSTRGVYHNDDILLLEKCEASMICHKESNDYIKGII